MNINLIKLYINKIKKEDINNFLIKNNIKVNDKELDYLYNILKNKYEDILNNDISILNEIKNNINEESYNKLYKLYIKYKDLYLS